MNTVSTTKTNKMYDVIIIGGGAAGMLAAISASSFGASVALIEKNAVTGKKIAITGKGRCNVTNDCSEREFLEHVVSNPRFLTKAIYAFPPSAVMSFFEEAGVPLKTERGRRVFPVSDRAEDINIALRDKMKQSGITLIRGCVTGISVEDKRVTGVRFSDSGQIKSLDSRCVILAAGGMSYPGTGSDGSGFALARSLGHSITEPRGSLVPIETKETWVRDLTGLSLKNVGVSFSVGGKTLFDEQGEMLFTHFGISGPLVLTGSAYIKHYPVDIRIDMKPALTPEVLDARLLSDFTAASNKDFANSLDMLLPKAMVPVVVALSGIDPHKKTNSVTRAERRSLAALLKAIPLTATAPRPVAEAIVTAGGVQVSEINPSTMASLLVSGLYFAGEVIDVDCHTGGYNLQTAFCTGKLAGKSAALACVELSESK